MKVISSLSLVTGIERSRDPVFALVIDGAATGGVIRACEEVGVSYVAARTFSNVEDTKVELISL